MTFREKLAQEHPRGDVDVLTTAICPSDFGYEEPYECEYVDCVECWNREMPDTEPVENVENAIEKHGEPAKPRLCEVLGVEEDEEFYIKGRKDCGTCWRIHKGIRQHRRKNRDWYDCQNEGNLAALINDPSLIIRKPRFSGAEMTVLRYAYEHGARTVWRNGNGYLYCTYLGNFRFLPYEWLPSIKSGQSVDLEELFGGDGE